MDDTLYITLKPIEKYALFLFAFLPGEHAPSSLFEIMRKKAQNGSETSVERLMRTMSSRGILRKKSANFDEYELKITFTREQLDDLARTADARSWWPTQDDVDAAKRKAAGSYGYYVSCGYSDYIYSIMLLVRDFALGPAKAGDKLSQVAQRSMKGMYRVKLAAAVSEWVREILPEGPDFSSRSWSDVFATVLPAWLTGAFLHGENCGEALDFIANSFSKVKEPDEVLHRVYAALRVWRGEGDYLLDAPKRAHYGAIYEPMIYAAGGNYATADKQLLFCGDGIETNRNIPEAGAASAVWALLVAFVAAAVKPDKVPRTRPVSIFRKIADSGRECDYATDPANVFIRHVSASAGVAATAWKGALDGKGERLRMPMSIADVSPLDALLMALDFRYLPVGRSSYRVRSEALAEVAKRYAGAGYALVASSLLSLLKGGYDEEKYGELRSQLFKKSRPFFPVTEVEPEWKNALVLLEKALPKKSSASEDETATSHLVWYVSLYHESQDCYVVHDVFPGLRPPAGAENGEDDHVMSWYDFDISRNRKFMTDEDYLLAMTLEASDGDVSDETVKCLCDMPNLMRADGFDPYERKYGNRKRIDCSPLTIVHGECRLESSFTEDGGLALCVPAYLSDIDGKGHVFLHALPDARFECLVPSREVCKLLEVFKGFGKSRRIVLPSAALRESDELVERLQEVMPFAERTAAEGEQSLKRMAADPRVVARLVYESGVLAVRAVVRPVASNAAMVFEPGAGAEERLVAGAVDSYVLVRNLAAERENLEAVVNVLNACEEYFDGRASWRFEDVEPALAALAALKAANPPVEMEWPQQKKLKVSYAPKSGVTLTSQRTAEDWFRVDGSFQLDDGRVIGIVQLLEAAKSRQGCFVQLSDGDFVALTQTMARELDALNAAGRRKGESIEIVKAAVPMLDGVFGQEGDSLGLPDALAKTADEIRAALAEKPSVPRALTAELRPYQRDGYRWLSRLARCGLGSCLADDMGLGKTLQVMTLLLERMKDGPSLVLAPSSVCGNWRAEIRRFAPTLAPQLAQETDGWKEASAGTVVIASYGYLLFHVDEFASVSWNGLVLDEAQAIKNDASKRAKAVKRLPSRFRVAATGTPVENRLGELWSLMDFLNPGLLGSAAGFTSRFTADGKATQALKRLVKPLILRRLKGDVLEDLPSKTEVTLPITLGTAERTAYEGCRQHALAVLAEKGEGEEGPNRMSILAELTRLRRFCCHPSLVLPDEALPSAKLEALLELLAGLKDGRHRALVFSQFTDYLAIVRKALESRGWSFLYLDGATPTVERGRLVDAFQGGEADFFLISLKAGGTGLNLTAADYVILLDPWWNPAVENQAADRAHRIGQTRPVTIYRLIASDTVEERVVELHHEKQAIAEDVLEGTGSTALTPAQLMRLFG